jgi:hypothetical protein
VDDALVLVAHGVEGDAELAAVVGQHVHLLGRDGVVDQGLAVDEGDVEGGDVVVHRRHGQVGAPDRAACQAQAVEGLGRGHLVDEVEIDVEEVRLTVGAVDDVGVPDLLAQGARTRGGLRHRWSSWSRKLPISPRGRGPLRGGTPVSRRLS